MESALLGRQAELALFDDLCDALTDRGAALLIDGDAGVGKTALVDEYERRAHDRGLLVLRATGTLAESGATYSGLHLLVQSLTDDIAALPPPQRAALDVAFGRADGPTPSPFLAGLAILSLLSEAARQRPLLVIAEDIHWFDTASRSALSMAARRVAGESMLVVMTCRSGYDVVDAVGSGIAQVRLEPLSFIDADALLDTRDDHPAGSARRTLLELAAGNPLALVELSPGQVLMESGVVALTHRLEVAFAGRYRSLPEPARLLTLALALVGETGIDDALAAVADVVDGPALDHSRWVSAAKAAGLLSGASPPVRFRHPLVPSAVISATDPDVRATMVRALSRTVRDSRRTVWWRAELTVGRDSELADELDQIAAAAEVTGDLAQTIAASRRAAELSAKPRRRDERRIRAADAALRSGAHDVAADLLDDVIGSTDSAALRCRALWLRELVQAEPASALTDGDLGPALAAIDGMSAAGDADGALTALLHLASISWNHSSDPDRGRVLAGAARRIDLDPDDPRMLFLTALTDPVNQATDVIARIQRRPDVETTPESAWYLGYALNLCGDIHSAATYLDAAVCGLRTRGNTSLLPHALMGRAWICYLEGRFSQARGHIDECKTLAIDLADPQLSVAADAATSWFDALDGQLPAGEVDTAASDLVATHTLAEGMANLVAGRPHDAQHAFVRLSDPADPAYTPMFSTISLPDLVEVTTLTGDRSLAQPRIDRVTQIARTWHAPAVDASLRFTQLITMCEDGELDEAADALDELPLPVPFFDARAHLHLGTALRRAHENHRGRRHLHTALEAFESFPAPAWAQRCRDELRAAGERLPASPSSGTALLTPQELRICQLAATGLTNREIGEQLFLSPRTIGAHLYAAFRKLGISRRRELRGGEVLSGRAGNASR